MCDERSKKFISAQRDNLGEKFVFIFKHFCDLKKLFSGFGQFGQSSGQAQANAFNQYAGPQGFGASNALAGAQSFQSGGALGSFGAGAANAGSQGFNVGPSKKIS